MKMNIGRVSSGYHFISFIAAENGISTPPVPQSSTPANAPTKPMAPNTRCPVISISIMPANMTMAIISCGIGVSPAQIFDVAEKLRQRLKDHQKDPETEHDLDRPERRAPRGRTALEKAQLVLHTCNPVGDQRHEEITEKGERLHPEIAERIGGGTDRAHEQHHQIEQQEEHGEPVHHRLRTR